MFSVRLTTTEREDLDFIISCMPEREQTQSSAVRYAIKKTAAWRRKLAEQPERAPLQTGGEA